MQRSGDGRCDAGMSTKQTIEALIEHEGFVRSLAKSLVSDHALADDLAQDTWVAALRRPPTGRGAVRGWLARVMRNQLRNRLRGDARRYDRETVVARDEIDDRTRTLQDRLGTQQLVVEAVLALPQKLRSVVLLHFYDGISLAEIARRRGVPAATVRSQLKRALDQMRERLDEIHSGGRESWSALLLAFDRDESLALSAAAGSGVGIGIGIGAIALAVLAVVVISLLGSYDGTSRGLDARLVLPESESDPTMAPAIMKDASEANDPRAERVPVHIAPERVFVLCRDQAGQPLSGVEVWVFQDVPRPDGSPRYQQYGPFTSAASGHAEGPVPHVSREGRRERLVYAKVPDESVGVWLSGQTVKGRTSLAPIEITLVPSRTVPGIVTVPEGFDLASVNVRVRYMRLPDWRQKMSGCLPRDGSFPGLESMIPKQFETRPDRGGRFEIRDVPVGGKLDLIAEAPGLSRGNYLNVGRGRETIPEVVEIAMWPEGIVAGFVTDPSGAAVPDAEVTIKGQGGNGIRAGCFEAATDARGAYRIDGLPATDFLLSIEATRQDLAFRPRAVSVERGRTTDLDLELEPAVCVAGTVIDSVTGEGIEGATVMAIEPHQYGEQPRLGFAITDDAGAFELWLPRGEVAIYFAWVTPDYVRPDPQVVERFTIEEDGSLIEDLRLLLDPVGDD